MPAAVVGVSIILQIPEVLAVLEEVVPVGQVSAEVVAQQELRIPEVVEAVLVVVLVVER